MKKKIIASILSITLIFSLLIIYLTLVGVETDRFNKQIKEEILKINNRLDIKLKKIKFTLDPIKLQITAKTIDPKIVYQKKTIDLEYIKTRIPLTSLTKNRLFSSNLEISTRSIFIKDLISFVQVINRKKELFILKSIIKNGRVTVDASFNFDKSGKIKDDYSISGTFKDGEINISNNYNFKKISFFFNLKNNNFSFQNVNLKSNDINFVSKNLEIKKIQKNFYFKGDIENEETTLNNKLLKLISKSYKNMNFLNINFKSKNNFSFILNKNLSFKNLEVTSNIKIKNSKYKKLDLFNKYLPKIQDLIIIKDHDIKAIYKDNELNVNGMGKIQVQNEFDQINYSISKLGDKFNFDVKLFLNKSLLNIDYLNFSKNKNLKTQIVVVGNYKKNNSLNFNEISLISKDNKIKFINFSINKNNKIKNLDKVELDYYDKENKKNQFLLSKNNKNEYKLDGKIFNANKLITDLLDINKEKKFNIFKNDFKLLINLQNVLIDDQNTINNVSGNLLIQDNKIHESTISAIFKNNKKLTFTINNSNGEKVTTLYSSKAKPFIKRYNFIKGFEEGDLNFYSSKKNNVSNSVLKIDNFKVKEIPVLAKLLSLASLQGIADLLTGEGIRFTDFEMIFSNKKNLMTIDEIYAIGPSISILMDGYIQKNELISLRGTLVPATTINRTISSIPLVGDFLIGKKVGEGVFGVSFKVKGPPNNLKTTVNPIKTLTPRFITRTLEKIKKN